MPAGLIQQVRSPAKGPITVLSSRPTGACYPSCVVRKDSTHQHGRRDSGGRRRRHPNRLPPGHRDRPHRSAPGHRGLCYHSLRQPPTASLAPLTRRGRVGVEGAGAYGSELARYLRANQVTPGYHLRCPGTGMTLLTEAEQLVIAPMLRFSETLQRVATSSGRAQLMMLLTEGTLGTLDLLRTRRVRDLDRARDACRTERR